VTLPLRSLLVVPGNRPERIAKAATYGADALALDLEDSGPAPEHEASRGHVCASIGSAAGTTLFVRTVGVGRPEFAGAASTGALDALDAEAHAALDAAGHVTLLTDADDSIASYLPGYGAEAVVVRPDRYMLGVADDREELERVLARIPAFGAVAAR
jgi:HpcH/HpaI aldolase/citrate lyase family